MSANEELRDRSIRHAIQIAAYGRGLSARIERLIEDADKELTEQLAGRLATISTLGLDPGPTSTARLNRVLRELRGLNKALYDALRADMSTELLGLAGAEAGFEAASLNRVLGVELAAIPSPSRLKAIVETSPMQGAVLADWFEGLERGRLDRVTRAIRIGLVQGAGIDDIVRSVRGTRALNYTDGVLDISRRSARMVVRTAVTHVSNVAAQETWSANSGVVKGWQFIATLDSRTTTDCASRDGKVYAIKQGDTPPLHPNCRSITVAVTKSFRELGVDKDEIPATARASMDGKVAGTTRYEDWLKGRSAAVQAEVLGVKRAQLFRDGELTFKQLVSGDGRLLTLEELKQAYPSLLL